MPPWETELLRRDLDPHERNWYRDNRAEMSGTERLSILLPTTAEKHPAFSRLLAQEQLASDDE
jgi:hypothetical protein